MAELATIARPYAEAAFALARDGGALPKWAETMGLLAAVVVDPEPAVVVRGERHRPRSHRAHPRR